MSWQGSSALDPKVGTIAACVEEERDFATSTRSSPFSLRGLLEIGGSHASSWLLRKRKRELAGLEETYNHMKRRSWNRKNAGVVLTVPKYIPFWLALFFTSYVIFVFISIFLLNNHDENEYIILGLVFLLAFILSPRVGEMIQWIIAEIYTALYIYYILSRTHNPILERKMTKGLTFTGFFCLVICASVVLLTILFYYGWPFLLRGYLTQWTQFAGVVEENKVEQGEEALSISSISLNNDADDDNHNTATRSSLVRPAHAMYEWLLLQHGDDGYHRCIRKFVIRQYQGYLHLLFPCFIQPKASDTHLCYYIGPLKDDLPHGLGAWFDSSPSGENLVGYFDHGIPVGPFESQENVTGAERGNVLINIRMIYMSDVKGMKTLTRAKPQWGVASAECCVSGNIGLDGYPLIRDICRAQTCQCLHSKNDVCTCAKEMLLKYYRHLEDTKRMTCILVSVDSDGMKVQGHYPAAGRTSLASRPQQVTISLENVVDNNPSSSFQEQLGSVSSPLLSNLKVDEQWERTADTEALVFIHGYNHMLVDALKRFGQFLAMAHLPSYLKTFVFNWPAGTSPLSYSLAVGNASSNHVQRDLDTFLQSLIHAGMRKVHFMVHSMGARLFLRAFPLIRKRFQPRQKHLSSAIVPSTTSVTGTSAVVVDISPDQIEKYHSNISSTTTDSNNEKPKKAVFSNNDVVNDDATQTAQDFTMELSTLCFLNPDYELEAFRTDFPDLYEVCNCITLYADKRDRAVQIAETFCWYQPSLGHQTTPFRDTFEQFCDMDIIDASDLAGNMSFTYHAYWNINRTMVDDLYEMIVFQRRANERRSRLFATSNGTFRFVTTPQNVNMI